PIAIAVLTGDPDAALTLRVRALFHDATVAQGVSAPLSLTPGQHLAAGLDLSTGLPDFGADRPDLAGPPHFSRPPVDLSGTDFAAPTDLAADALDAAPDLPFFTPDLPSFTADMFQPCQAVTVSTLVGSAGGGFQDGVASVAKVNNPVGIAVDSSGNL